MSWPWRCLLPLGVWALGFALIYAVHGLGCAWNFAGQAAPLGNWQQVSLIGLWLLFLLLGLLLLWMGPGVSVPAEQNLPARLVRLASLTGLVATALTLFPVLGLTSCRANSSALAVLLGG